MLPLEVLVVEFLACLQVIRKTSLEAKQQAAWSAQLSSQGLLMIAKKEIHKAQINVLLN